MAMMTKAQQRDQVRRKVRSATDPEKYTYYPEKGNNEYVKSDEFQLVGIYARVSTDDPSQTSSFELQQKYYMDLVARNSKWRLVKIYSDEGKSGTTTQHRVGFQEMMDDAYAGRLNLIIVKNISRLARNVVDFLSTIRKLRERKVGVLFESEGIYSLNSNSHMALSFQATVAEEESRLRSRSMETSLRMRLDHGLPLTPELLGFVKDESGKLRINHATYEIPKLIFYMYLYGYSTQQIAEKLIQCCKKSYLGNIKWTATGVARILRNERYCGDVLTRKRYKVFAPDADEQKTFKNTGEKPQSYYRDEHDGIITRDDFVAVQRMMNNAKFGGTSPLPELRVIPDGLLKGFVIVHPKWGSFSTEDYYNACRSVESEDVQNETEVAEKAGNFDLRGYEVANFKLFDDQGVSAVMLGEREMKFNKACIRNMEIENEIELLIHPKKKMLAIRPAPKESRYVIQWARGAKENQENRDIACTAYGKTLLEILGWNQNYRYKMYGCIYRDGNDKACIFSAMDSSMYIHKDQYLSTAGVNVEGQLLNLTGKYIRAVAGDLSGNFGREYYVEKSYRELRNLTRAQWQTSMEGRMCTMGERLRVTPYEELRGFIQKELGEYFEEVQMG